MRLSFPGLRPAVHGEEAVYFEYCQKGELRVQNCRSCKRYIFYPRSICPFCLSSDIEWVPANGGGFVHTFTVQQRAAPGFEGPLPYIIAIIELVEGVRLLSRVIGDADSVFIGMPVVAAWATIDNDGFQVPVFLPASADTTEP